MALAIQEETRLTLVQTEAIAAINRAGGDRKLAAGALEAQARKNPALMQSLMERDLASRCWDAIRAAERLLKPNTLSALPVWSRPDSEEAAAIQRREGGDRLSSLYFWCLPGRKPLGGANKEDLTAAIDHFQHLESGNRIQRLWLEAVRARVKGNQTVEKCLTEKKLAQLLEEATSKAAAD